MALIPTRPSCKRRNKRRRRGAYNLGSYSLVKMESYRFGLGADYLLRPRVTTYARYNYYDYQDDSGLTSGQASMFLVGASATF